MTMPSITVLTQLDPLTYRAICELLPQLTASLRLPTYSELSEIVDAPCTRLLVARDGDQLLGMLTLVLVRLPSARVAHVEDVVVDEVSRGKGVGRLLLDASLTLATEAGATHVDLTSRPARTAANGLYQSLGFELRETNVYRYAIRG